MSSWQKQLQAVTAPLRASLSAAWAQRSARERQLLGLAAVVLALAAVWRIALAPALQTWHEAPARQAALDRQSAQMRQLQAQAQSLKNPSAITRADAVQWLERNLLTLGADAKLSLQGERATLNLQATPAESLATWLQQAREHAQALPVQAQLRQVSVPAAAKPGTATATSAAKAPDAAASSSAVRWSGSLVMSLP
ncbi:type II secretion system protein GspM [Limnohabitans sp. DM1]|uniref:type II secretion system protein GspM n=1 Tax=Limnohabitans sp. DM1 TaxID=1597955 RepID=UPI000AE8BD56|nr:type II secretion system protein GspM [Limnohabitans sp. DM1]